MANKKKTVDYFPHRCRSGATVSMLLRRYGAAGYMFWFRLLEVLGDTTHHFVDCSNFAQWENILEKTMTNDETAKEIIELLVQSDALDAELWENNVIYSQNFIDGITDAYRQRKENLLSRDDIEILLEKSRLSRDYHGIITGLSRDASGKGKERKRKEKKEEEIREKGQKTAAPIVAIPLKNGSEFVVTEQMLKGWQQTYELVDVHTVLKEIRQWNVDNPAKRKTKGGIRRHIGGWLKGENEKLQAIKIMEIRKRAKRMVGAQSSEPMSDKEGLESWWKVVREVAADPERLAVAMKAGEISEADLKDAGVKRGGERG